MKNIQEKISGIDWQMVSEQMHEKGLAIVPQILSDEDCRLLINNYGNQYYYRKTITI